MKTTRAASILLMLSLAGLSAAAAVPDDTLKNAAILLPGDGGAGLVDLLTAMTRATTQGEEEKRPWKCCDEALCTRSIPPICRCVDRVDRCSKACKQCEETEDSRHTCADWYHGFPGPKCRKDGGFAFPGVTLAEATTGKIDEETRPWECCDAQACALHWPTSCLCFDEFARCPDACQSCEEVKGSGRYRCNDVLRGAPAPPCSRRGGGMPRAVRRGGYGY